MNARFDSPNDLAIRSDGTIYFTDPDWQAPTPRPQTKTRVYKVASGASTATVIDENRQQPNGITLSLDENTLFVASGAGHLQVRDRRGSGTVGAGTQSQRNNVSSGDGMAMDCAGNLYIAANATAQLLVVSPAGTSSRWCAQQGITNVAFGGTDHKTLYLTAQGTAKNGPMGLFKIAMPLPGMPY